MRLSWMAVLAGALLSCGAARAADEIVLFDGKDVSAWESQGGGECTWKVENGVMVSNRPNAQTKQKFKDYKLHLEFWLPKTTDEPVRGRRANSGVYLQGFYEIQILDSYGLSPITWQDSGSIYKQKAPDVQASTPPETWQTFDITFRAARYEGGKRTEKAKFSLTHNGKLVQDNIEINGSSPSGDKETGEPGPIRLQYHTGNVKFRNIRITPTQ